MAKFFATEGFLFRDFFYRSFLGCCGFANILFFLLIGCESSLMILVFHLIKMCNRMSLCSRP